MRVACDTGPLLAAADRRSPVHRLAAGLVAALGRDLIILDVVLTEADHMLRRRVGSASARGLLDAVASGIHTPAFLSPGLVSRARDLDRRYGDLRLGFVDASLMAYAERHDLPILTFDFRDFRATASARGPWRLLVDEEQLARATDR